MERLDTSLWTKLAEPFLLGLLERGEAHGYGLVKELSERFGAEPAKGRIYQILKRMEEDRLVSSRKAEEGNRVLYTITEAGRRALAEYRKKPLPFYDMMEAIWGLQKPAAIRGHAAVHDYEEAAKAAGGHIPTGATAPAPPLAPGEACPACAQGKVRLDRDTSRGQIFLTLEWGPDPAVHHRPDCPVHRALMALALHLVR